MINRLLFIDTDERFDGLPDSLGVILIILEGSFKELRLSQTQLFSVEKLLCSELFCNFPSRQEFFIFLQFLEACPAMTELSNQGDFLAFTWRRGTPGRHGNPLRWGNRSC